MRPPDSGQAAARLRTVFRPVRGRVRLRGDEGEGDTRVDRAGAEELVAVQGSVAGRQAGDGVPFGVYASQEGGPAGEGTGVQGTVHQGRLVQLPDVFL